MPASTRVGVRTWINFTVLMLKIYERHKDNIDPHLAPNLKGIMESLLALVDLIDAANVAGPDPFVPDNIGSSGL